MLLFPPSISQSELLEVLFTENKISGNIVNAVINSVKRWALKIKQLAFVMLIKVQILMGLSDIVNNILTIQKW